MTQRILCSVDEGLCRITLNRPEKLNALSLPMFEEIEAQLDRLNFEEVGCILLTGRGRSFCAGHDLDDLADGAEGTVTGRRETMIVERLAMLPVPVVAAVRGHCLTGGLELALAADIIIAADDVQFADTHAKWDLVPIWGLSQRLPRRVGRAKAFEMMFACRNYGAIEAVAMGLANFSVPSPELDTAAEAFCRSILANSWRATRAVKRLVDQTDGLPLAAGIAWELHRTEGEGPQLADRLARMRRR